ncbi:MAG: HAMP domain-containing histidine kinase [Muribaculaceae bacterium]|nr:HAMP domain-containing histidine kinase [Muribaculaceae bacterium]
MENKIKTLYILSIAAILAFLAMQAYWLYTRYEYSLKDYEDRAEIAVANALIEYDRARSRKSSIQSDTFRVMSSFNMNHDIDSLGKPIRKVTVSTKIIRGKDLLRIKGDRKLTPKEMTALEKIILDSIEKTETKRATLDVTSAPSDGAAWSSMKNFELEVQSPFTVEGIDSILKKENIIADVSLLVTDSMSWKPISTRHSSLIHPRIKITTHYSELEHKAVVTDCRIPVSEIIKEMGWTLLLAFILSLFLILCLAWQIKTIVKLTRLDKMRNSFITTMIHELKRPITTLKMCVSGIDNERMMEDPQLRHEMASETRIALDNLAAYFSKLRDITFNNVEQIPLYISSFNLANLVDEVTHSITLPSNKHVKFENQIPEDLEISADRTHMTNIIINLIENAIKYSGENVTVVISTESTADGIGIKIADNGNGIPASSQNKIFDRFYRGNASSTDIPGMGLGLAYVKLLVDAHGGDISVESTENIGSTFTINLPQ